MSKDTSTAIEKQIIEKHWEDYEVQISAGSWTTVANLMRESKQSLIQEIREKIIEYPSGNCPSCVNGSNIHGLHPHDSLHHFMFYNKALDEVLTILEEMK